MMRSFLNIPQVVLIVMLGVALATSGFVHRFASPADQARALYMQTYGLSAADLCGDEEAVETRDCEACRLHAAMSLPTPANAIIVAELGLRATDQLPEPAPRRSLTTQRANPARGPPIV